MTILDIIITLLFLLLESFFITYLINILITLFDKNISRKNFKYFALLWLTIYMVFLTNKAIHIFIPTFKWLKPLLFMLAITFVTHLIYKIKLFKGVIISVICSVLSAVIEIVIALILKECDISPQSIANDTLYSSIYACSIALFEALLAFIVHLFNKSLSHTENKLKCFAPQLIAIVICLLPTMVLFMQNDFKYSNLFIIVNFFQLITVTLVGLYNLHRTAKHEDMEMKLANTIIYNETLKKVNEGVRGFKHDMGNIVQAILGYIAINDSEGAKKYCQNLVIGFNDINVLSILSPTVIDEPAIYGIVVNKILLAREKNMALALDITTNVSEINFPKFELSRILGILIDNAIEAGETTEEKRLIVNIRRDYNNNCDVIIISNSVNDVNIDVDKIFSKDYSTKANPSGFGLYEVTKFLKKYPQGAIQSSIDKKNKLFTQTLVIRRVEI